MIPNILYCLLFAWSLWCICSRKVKDGVIGRIGYSAVAIAAFAALVSHHPATIPVSNSVIITAVALLGARHFVLKHLATLRKKHP